MRQNSRNNSSPLFDYMRNIKYHCTNFYPFAFIKFKLNFFNLSNFDCPTSFGSFVKFFTYGLSWTIPGIRIFRFYLLCWLFSLNSCLFDAPLIARIFLRLLEEPRVVFDNWVISNDLFRSKSFEVFEILESRFF